LSGQAIGDAPAPTRIPVGPRTLFVIEQNEKLKDAFRKLKERGYRVLISIDPNMALERYKQQPYHALIVDARTVGKDGVDAFNRVLREAEAVGLDLGAVLILGEDQVAWKRDATQRKNGAVMIGAVTMRDVLQKLYELSPPDEEDEEEASSKIAGA